MFHDKIIPDDGLVHCKSGEIALQTYFLQHEEALSNAAVLLGGRRGARLINAIQEAISKPGSIGRRRLIDLHNLLMLESAYDKNWDDDAFIAFLEPDDPRVPKICLLADGLEEALRDAGLIDREVILAP